MLVWERESFVGLGGAVVQQQQLSDEEDMVSSFSTTALQQQVPFGTQLVGSASASLIWFSSAMDAFSSSCVSAGDRGFSEVDNEVVLEPPISDVKSGSQVT